MNNDQFETITSLLNAILLALRLLLMINSGIAGGLLVAYAKSQKGSR